MTDPSTPDHLPHHLEPPGSVHPCQWTREANGNHTTTCGETWPAFITLPKGDEPCPWCGRATRIEGSP